MTGCGGYCVWQTVLFPNKSSLSKNVFSFSSCLRKTQGSLWGPNKGRHNFEALPLRWETSLFSVFSLSFSPLLSLFSHLSLVWSCVCISLSLSLSLSPPSCHFFPLNFQLSSTLRRIIFFRKALSAHGFSQSQWFFVVRKCVNGRALTLSRYVRPQHCSLSPSLSLFLSSPLLSMRCCVSHKSVFYTSPFPTQSNSSKEWKKERQKCLSHQTMSNVLALKEVIGLPEHAGPFSSFRL